MASVWPRCPRRPQRLRAGGLSPPPSFEGLTAPCSETARRGSDAGIAQQPQGVVRALPLGPAAPPCGGERPAPRRLPGVSPPSPRHPPQRPHQRPRPRSEQRETHRRFHSLVLWPWRNMRILKRLDCLKSIFSFVSQYMKKEKKSVQSFKNNRLHMSLLKCQKTWMFKNGSAPENQAGSPGGRTREAPARSPRPQATGWSGTPRRPPACLGGRGQKTCALSLETRPLRR